MKFLLISSLVLILALKLVAGEIIGTVTVKGAVDNGDAVVYIEKNKDMKFPVPEQEPTMDQKNLKFVPHVMPVMVGVKVKFKNNDKVAHNVFTPSPAGDRFNLGTWQGNQVKTHIFNKTGEVVLLCNLHPEMEAYVYVAPTPYFARTDATGKFEIGNVPAGSYTFKVWSEHGNARPQKVIVPEKGPARVNFTIK